MSEQKPPTSVGEDEDPDRGNGEFYQSIGVGPHPQPWPAGEQYDPDLLTNGDRRNVVDKYRYWTVEAIRADLDTKRRSLHVAIENWQHDLNIGAIVRTANAFNVAAVHIVGRKKWNRRGAMVTDKYMHIHHHADVQGFAAWADQAKVPIVGIENIEPATLLQATTLPNTCVLFFGNEGTGLSDEAISACSTLVQIEQSGSTRSMNASAAAAIAMWAWTIQH